MGLLFFKNGLWTIYPYFSKVVNNGFDGSGTHCGNGQTIKIGGIDRKPYMLLDFSDCKDMTKRTSGNSAVKMIKNYVKRVSGMHW